jgi:hypothetical protein
MKQSGENFQKCRPTGGRVIRNIPMVLVKFSAADIGKHNESFAHTSLEREEPNGRLSTEARR